MSVFLRWGVFGILAVAAVVYAYNASKRMSEHRQARAAAAPAVEAAETADDPEVEPAAPGDVAEDAAEAPEDRVISPACEEEQEVAERALKMRRDGEPLDRLLRIQLIAFQSDPQRRERLETVARKWFEREGRDPDQATQRRETLRDCQAASRAP